MGLYESDKSDTNDFKLVDFEEVFALNPDMKIEVSKIEPYNTPYVEIKNFYKNPEMVRQHIIEGKVDKNKLSDSGFSGHRITEIERIPISISNEILKILKENFEDIENLCIVNNSFEANIYDSSGNRKGPNIRTHPHIDTYMMASVVYMNYDNEPVGGTAMYKNKSTSLSLVPVNDNIVKYFKSYHNIDNFSIDINNDMVNRVASIEAPSKGYNKKFILEDNDEWEITKTIESEFNKAIFYYGAQFHSPLIDFKVLKECGHKRINQVIFFDKLENINSKSKQEELQKLH